MERWEYFTGYFAANIRNEGVQEYVSKRWPEWDPPQFSPELLIPELNNMGEQGWELISIVPAFHKAGGDHHQAGQYGQLTNDYLAVFKRRLSDPPAETEQTLATGTPGGD